MNSERINRLRRSMAGRADAAIITSGENCFYFTGFHCDAGLLLVSGCDSIFFTDSRYTEAAERAIGREFVVDNSRLFDDLNRYFTENVISVAAI